MVGNLEDLNFAAIAKKHGITRSAVSRWAANGWTREEIEQGHRNAPPKEEGKSRYNSKYTEQLKGFDSKVVAELNKVSIPGLYYRLQNGKPISLPGEEPVDVE